MSVRLQAWLIIGGLSAAVFLSNPYAFLPDPARADLKDPPRPDFLAFYSAGKLIRQDPAQLYKETKQAEIQSSVLGRPVDPEKSGFMPFVYPAVVAVLFLPFAWLSYPTAFVAMLATNVVLCGLALDLLCRRFHLNPQKSRLMVVCAALSIPVILTLANGQISFLIFIILTLLISDIREKKARAGIWTGLLAIKPTLAPVFLLWFLVTRQWKTLGYAALTGLTVLLLSFILAGPHAVSDFWDMSLKMATAQYATVNPSRMPNLRAVSDFVGYGDIVGIILSLLVLSVLLMKGRMPSDAACSALILATVLLARHIHYQDLNPILIIIAMTLRAANVTLLVRCGLLAGTLLTTVVVLYAASHGLNVPILPLSLLAAFGVFVLKIRPLRDRLSPA